MIPLSLISKDNYSEILPDEHGEPEWILDTRKKAMSKFSELPFEVSPLVLKIHWLNLVGT